MNTYDRKVKARGAWASWSASAGIAAGALALQLGADEGLAVAITGFGAASAEVITVLVQRVLAKAGLPV
jgi:hypothetical protein